MLLSHCVEWKILQRVLERCSWLNSILFALRVDVFYLLIGQTICFSFKFRYSLAYIVIREKHDTFTSKRWLLFLRQSLDNVFWRLAIVKRWKDMWRNYVNHFHHNKRQRTKGRERERDEQVGCCEYCID